eukprot:429543_1
MLDHKLYWILLGGSQIILIILWSVSIHQICITDNFRDKKRLRRVFLVFFNIFCLLSLNILVYMSAMYPHQQVIKPFNVHTLYIIWQGFTALVVFHTWRKLFMFIIKTVYNDSRIHAPKFYEYFFDILEFIFVIAVFICHGLAIVYNTRNWIYAFYLILGVEILIIAIFVLVIFQKALRLYKSISQTPTNEIEIKNAIFMIKGATYVGIFVCICALIDIGFTAQKIIGFFNFQFDFLLISNIMHSVIQTALSFCEILWIYKTKYCCAIPEDSVCDIWCVWCNDDMNDFNELYDDKKHIPILLENSTVTGTTHLINNAEASITTINESVFNASSVVDVRT